MKLIYRSVTPPDYQEKQIFGVDQAVEILKRPPLFPLREPEPEPPAQPDYSCKQCGALSFVAVDVCDECLKPDPEPPAPLDYSCRRCGALSFLQIDICDDCEKAERKNKRKGKKPRRKKIASKPPEKVFAAAESVLDELEPAPIEPEQPNFEKLTALEVERKKGDLNRLQYKCQENLFGPNQELPDDRKKRLVKLKTYQTEYEYLGELIAHNIGLYLESPRPNLYNSRPR